MIKQTFVLEVIVDEDNISELYGNYSINWNSPQEFINHLVDNFQEGVIDEDGYTVKVLSRDETKVRDLDLDEIKSLEDYSIGDLVKCDGLPYVVCDIDDEGLKLADNSGDNGFWVELEDLD